MTNILRLVLILGLVLVAGSPTIAAPPGKSGPAASANAPAAPPSTAPVPAAPTAAAATKPEDLARLIATLNDPVARDRLIADLQMLLDAERHQTAAPTDSDGLVGAVREQVGRVSDQVRETTAMMVQAPFILSWFQRQVTDPDIRAYWLTLFGKLAIVIAAALIAEWLVKRGLARQRFAFIKPGESRRRFRMLSVAARALIAILSIGVFVSVPLLILPFLALDPVDLHVALLGVQALVVVRLALIAANLAVIPHPPFLAIFDIEPAIGQQIVRWTHRIAGTVAYGVAFVWSAQQLGIPWTLYNLSLKLLSIALAIEAITLIFRLRQPVARLIRGRRAESGGPRAGGALADARRRFAEDWHVPAILYVGAVLILSLFDVQGGLAFALRATVISAVAVTIGQVLLRFARATLAQEPKGAETGGFRLPMIARRLGGYLPIVTAGIGVAINTLVVFTLLWAWGIDVFGLLATTAGREILSRLGSVAVIIILALTAWEIANAAIERQLMGLESNVNTTPARRAARLQTLLPLFRNALMITILTVTALSALSAIGINIAPLLAGAGVVGVAIGFGSQTLVKDMITGLFILLENTLAVGDVVDLGGGHSGVVEALSIRTIRLRDLGGSVHALPFSAVQTVVNRTKDYAYHVFDQQIGLDADVDRAQAVLAEVVDEMRADPEVGPLILSGVEIFGVDELGNSGTLTIKGRIKTLPGQQWAVRRAFNSRLAKALPAAGIPFPGSVVQPTLAQEFAGILEKLREAQMTTGGGKTGGA